MEDEDDTKDVLNSDGSSSSGPLWIQSRYLPSSASTTNDNDEETLQATTSGYTPGVDICLQLDICLHIWAPYDECEASTARTSQ